MAVRSKRLFGPVAIGTATSPIYTCPAGETALLKSLWLWPTGPTVSAVSVFINGTAAANQIGLIIVPNSAEIRLAGQFLVLHPGDTLTLRTNLGTATVAGFGAELEGVAD